MQLMSSAIIDKAPTDLCTNNDLQRRFDLQAKHGIVIDGAKGFGGSGCTLSGVDRRGRRVAIKVGCLGFPLLGRAAGWRWEGD
jgi:hypothetical protein